MNEGCAIWTPWTVTVTVVLWVIVPLVPVTVTRYAPAVLLVTLRLLVPDIVTLVGLRVAVRSVELTVATRLTTPLNPPSGAMVIVELPVPPMDMVRDVGLAVIVKSGVVTTSVIIAVVCDSVPLMPVTVTV